MQQRGQFESERPSVIVIAGLSGSEGGGGITSMWVYMNVYSVSKTATNLSSVYDKPKQQQKKWLLKYYVPLWIDFLLDSLPAVGVRQKEKVCNINYDSI